MNKKVFLAFFWLGVVVSCWTQVILDVRKYQYQEILSLVQRSPRIFQGIWIATPFKGYTGRFLPTEAVYDFTDLGDKLQRGSRETFLGSREQFEKLVDWCKTNAIKIYARIRLFEQAEGFSTYWWEISDFYPDYTIAFERPKTHRKLQTIVEMLQKYPIDVWVVDVTRYSLSYQMKASAWVRQNFPQALVMGDEEDISTLSALSFWRWQVEMSKTNSIIVPSFHFSGVYWIAEEGSSSMAVFYYFLLRQRKKTVIISPSLLNACYAVERVKPEEWSDVRFASPVSDHLWGISSKGVFSFYRGEMLRFTNYQLSVPSKLSPVIGKPLLVVQEKNLEGLFLPWSFSLWVIKK